MRSFMVLCMMRQRLGGPECHSHFRLVRPSGPLCVRALNYKCLLQASGGANTGGRMLPGVTGRAFKTE